MLKLIKCEFWKLKRKKLIYAFLSLALFFPCYFGIYDKSRFDGRYDRTLSANPNLITPTP